MDILVWSGGSCLGFVASMVDQLFSLTKLPREELINPQMFLNINIKNAYLIQSQATLTVGTKRKESTLMETLFKKTMCKPYAI